MVVVTGGRFAGNPVKETEFLDLATEKWQLGPALPIGYYNITKHCLSRSSVLKNTLKLTIA